MRNKLLITTALVAVSFAANAYAADLIVSETKEINNGIFNEYENIKVAKDATLKLSSDVLPHYEMTADGVDLVEGVTQVRSVNDITVNGTLNMKNSVLEAGNDMDELPNNSNILVDGATVTMDNSALEANGDITIKNSKLDIKNTIDVDTGIWADKTLTVSGGETSLDNSYLTSAEGLILDGGTYNFNDSTVMSHGQIDVKGGTFELAGSIEAENIDGKYNGTGGDLNISGGTINAKNGSELTITRNANMNISGNAKIVMDYTGILSEGDNHNGGILHEGQKGDINISGGTIELSGEVAKIERGGYDNDWIYSKSGEPMITEDEFARLTGMYPDEAGANPEIYQQAGLNIDDVDVDGYHVSEGNINITGGNISLKDGARISTTEKNTGDIVISGGNLDLTKAYISAAGNITLNEGSNIVAEKGVGENSFVVQTWGGDINVNGGNIDVKNASVEANNGGNINISGGTINLAGSDINAWDGAFTMTGGTINMNDGDAAAEHNDLTLWAAKDITLSGGVINMNGENTSIDTLYDLIDGDGNLIENPNAPGNIIINGSEINVNSASARISTEGEIELSDKGVINVKEGAVLTSHNAFKMTEDDMESYGKATIKMLQGGTINLGGTLSANIDADSGTVNIQTSTAQIDGNADIPTLVFNASHKMSEVITGKYGADDLFVNKGTLTYDKAPALFDNSNENTFLSVRVADGATLDILNNTLVVNGYKEEGDGVFFKDNSTLKFTATSAEEHGKILANYVNISENGTTLDMTFNGAALAEGESLDIQLFDQSEDKEGVEIEGEFANLTSNSRYDFVNKGNGVYTVTGVHSASDIVADAGGSVNHVSTAEAWDNLDTSKVSNETTVAVAQKLAALSNSNSSAGQKAYVDALTAVAPEVAPAVQQTQTETANQVFGAVGTRLSGGSVNAGNQGMSSGDNPFERIAVWVQGLFNKSKLDDTSKAKGFDADTYGTAFGIEKQLDRAIKAGVGYAYSTTDIDGFMRDTDVDTHTAIVYGEYKPSSWYVNGIASYGWSDYSEDKNVAGIGVKADYDVETFGLQAMTGYDMNINGFWVTPEVGLRYVHISQDGYKDSADQRVSANDSDILTGVIGAKVSKNFELKNGMIVKPEARVAATYDLFNDKVNSVVTLANGSAYSINGEALDRFGMEFGAGVTAEVNEQVELSLGYEGKFREDYQDHTGLINAKYKF